MIKPLSLKDYSWKDLAEMARSKGLARWHSMRKDELVKALARATKSKAAPARKSLAVRKPEKAESKPIDKQARAKARVAPARQPAAKLVRPSGAKPARSAAASAQRSARVSQKIQRAHEERDRLKDLSGGKPQRKSDRDRLVLMVRDPYWLHACWHVSPASVKRAEAALAEQWHTARPVLRVLQVDAGSTTSTAERLLRQIDIHGGVTNWYIDAPRPPQSFRVEIGYVSAGGKFFSLARSNKVSTPAPGHSEADHNWEAVAENYERVYALSGGYSEDHTSGELQELFEERLRRPMGASLGARYGMGAEAALKRHRDFRFDVDAEMLLFGNTKADANVTVGGDPIKVRPDGTFSLRLSMPDKRQVIPVVASSADGVEQRTIVLAVERNTKVLEPMLREHSES